MNQPQDTADRRPIIPVVHQPRGLSYFFGTWSGRIITLNTLVFLAMLLKEPGSLLLPSPALIQTFGSKSLSDIALGEYWRFISPMFVHIGGLHFFFNTMGLFYIGYQIESILGGPWFVGLYLASGLIGNLSSCEFSLATSAGASGAIFGLLGAGFRLEKIISDFIQEQNLKSLPRGRVYTGMAISNLILGFIIPVMDNAAHIGGFVCGLFLTEAMLRLRPNRLRPKNPALASGIFVALFLFAVAVIFRAVSPSIVSQRYLKAAERSSSAPEAYHLASEAIKVEPLHAKARLLRGKLLLMNGELNPGVEDVKKALQSPHPPTDKEWEDLLQSLEESGHDFQAQTLRDMKENLPKDSSTET